MSKYHIVGNHMSRLKSFLSVIAVVIIQLAKLLTEHHLEFLSLKVAAKARLSLHLSKCHIVGNLMHWLILEAGMKCAR